LSDENEFTDVEAVRGGEKTGRVRYILGISIAIAVVAMIGLLIFYT